MKSLTLSLFALLLSMPAAALSPEAEAYLRSVGLDPASEEVRLAEQAGEIQTTYMDEPVTFSVESLASEKKKNGLIRFVATRAFIAKLKQNFDATSIPERNYESLYLTGDERALVGKKVATSMLSGRRPA